MTNLKGTRNQYFAAFSVNLLSVSFGASLGWLSACFAQLLHPDTNRLDPREHLVGGTNLLISFMSFGVLVGTILFGWLAERFGRRNCLLLMTIPAVLKWLLIIFARHYYQLFVERFIAGTVGGCCLAVIPIYITEMAEDRLRGTLGTFMVLSTGIGMLVIHILGYFFHYVTAAWIMLLIPVAFLSTFIFVPDTPEYLERYHKEGVEKSLRYFRGISSSENAQLQVELTKLTKPFQSLESGDIRDDNNLRISDFTNRKALKAFFIGLGIILAKELTGYQRMTRYSVSVFWRFWPIESSIIVIGIQLLGMFTATLLVERVGRKALLLMSTAGICLGQVLMAIYLYINMAPSQSMAMYLYLHVDQSQLSGILIVYFALIMYSGGIGVMTVDFVIITEITAPKIRRLIVRLQVVILILIASNFSKEFHLLHKLLGVPGVISVLAVLSLLLTIFIALCVPETKGKSIEDIQKSI